MKILLSLLLLFVQDDVYKQGRAQLEEKQYDAAEQRGGDQLRARGQADELNPAAGTDDDFARSEPPANNLAKPGLHIFHLCYTPQQSEALKQKAIGLLGDHPPREQQANAPTI